MDSQAETIQAEKARQDDEIAALFGQLNPDGTPRFSDAEVNHFLPMAVLCSGHDTRPFPQLHALMRQFILGLDLPAGVDSETFSRAVHAYYRRFPPNRLLEAEFFAYCRSQARGELDADKVRQYAKTAGLKLADHSPLKGIATTRPAAGLQLRRR